MSTSRSPRLAQLALYLCTIVFVSVTASAQIVSGVDTANAYPNAASLAGVFHSPNGSFLRIRCSGSLLHKDETKIVILTAAHCTDSWKYNIAMGDQDYVAVSFDVNNQIDGNYIHGNSYVRDGVPVSFPARNRPFEFYDYGLVVFPTTAINSANQTIEDRWPGLTPVTIPIDPGYVAQLIQGTTLPQLNLEFAAVGYGIGPKIGRFHDLSTFTKREVARLTYNALNPGNDILRLSMNANLGEDITCNGDSGGPVFHTNGQGERIQVSLVSGGDMACRGTNTGPGFGTQLALDFIGCGRVPGTVGNVEACVNSLLSQ